MWDFRGFERIVSKIEVKKTKSFRLGINEDEEVTFGNKILVTSICVGSPSQKQKAP